MTENGSIAELLETAARLVRAQEDEVRKLREQAADQAAARRRMGSLADMPDVLTAKDISEFMRVRPSTVYAMFKAGKIRSFSGGASGKSVRCMKADFIEWLEHERRQSRNDEDGDVVIPMRIAKGRRRKEAIS